MNHHKTPRQADRVGTAEWPQHGPGCGRVVRWLREHRTRAGCPFVTLACPPCLCAQRWAAESGSLVWSITLSAHSITVCNHDNVVGTRTRHLEGGTEWLTEWQCW